MVYEVRVTVPPNTTRDNAVRQVVKVAPGTLEQLEIEFPTGCAGLVHVQILYQDVQTWPSNLDQSFTGNGSHLVFRESLPVKKAPFEFIIRAWNLDDTYPHTPIIRFQITPPGSTLYERLLKIFGVKIGGKR